MVSTHANPGYGTSHCAEWSGCSGNRSDRIWKNCRGKILIDILYLTVGCLLAILYLFLLNSTLPSILFELCLNVDVIFLQFVLPAIVNILAQKHRKDTSSPVVSLLFIW
jgi:hypothetical protein